MVQGFLVASSIDGLGAPTETPRFVRLEVRWWSVRWLWAQHLCIIHLITSQCTYDWNREIRLLGFYVRERWIWHSVRISRMDQWGMKFRTWLSWHGCLPSGKGTCPGVSFFIILPILHRSIFLNRIVHVNHYFSALIDAWCLSVCGALVPWYMLILTTNNSMCNRNLFGSSNLVCYPIPPATRSTVKFHYKHCYHLFFRQQKSFKLDIQQTGAVPCYPPHALLTR